MGQTGRCTDHNRLVVLLADLVGQLRHVLGFLGIRRLENRDLSRTADHAGVLLVLGAVETRVVRDAEDHAAAHAGIGCRVDRVRRHVVADHLHAGKGTDARNRSAEGDFRRDFLVRSPLAVQGILVLDQVFTDFRAGCARIRGGHLDAGFVEAARDGFISEHQSFLTQFLHLLFYFYLRCSPNQSRPCGLHMGRKCTCYREIQLYHCKAAKRSCQRTFIFRSSTRIFRPKGSFLISSSVICVAFV